MATSVADAVADKTAERLRAYRSLVARAAARQPLSPIEYGEIDKLLRALGLPGYAWTRDVQAVRDVGRLCSLRRAELALNHPHLFEPESDWVRRRSLAIERQNARRAL